MNRITATGALLASVILAQPVHAADWRFVAAGGGDRVFYDALSLTSEDSKMTLWVKFDYSGNRSEKAHYSVAKYVIACDSHKMKVLSSVYYKASGIVIQSFDTPQEPFTDIVPESIGEVIEQEVCQWQVSK